MIQHFSFVYYRSINYSRALTTHLVAVVLVVLSLLGRGLDKHVDLVTGHREVVVGAPAGVQDHSQLREIVQLLDLPTMSVFVL